MHPHTRLRSLRLAATVLTAAALFVGAQGFLSVPTTSAQEPYMAPMPMEVSPSMSSSVLPVTRESTPAPAALGTLYRESTHIIPGRYCTDKTGGKTYVLSGAPIEAGLKC